MIRIAWRSLTAHKLRTILTTLAILLGVAMICGTYVLSDQIDRGFKNIFTDAYKGIDVAVTRKAKFSGEMTGAGRITWISCDPTAYFRGSGATSGIVKITSVSVGHDSVTADESLRRTSACFGTGSSYSSTARSPRRRSIFASASAWRRRLARPSIAACSARWRIVQPRAASARAWRTR